MVLEVAQRAAAAGSLAPAVSSQTAAVLWMHPLIARHNSARCRTFEMSLALARYTEEVHP